MNISSSYIRRDLFYRLHDHLPVLLVLVLQVVHYLHYDLSCSYLTV